MDTGVKRGFELWVPQSLLLSKICGIDVSQAPYIGTPSNPDCKNPFNLLFFTPTHNFNEPTLSFPICTLFRNCPNFDGHANDILSADESEKIEKFRECFLALLNQGRGTGFSDKVAFLNVAFLHFGGKTSRGYMSKGEIQCLATTYTGIFDSGKTEESVFTCLDRKDVGMISDLDFVCGFIACSPEVNDSPKSHEGKLRLQHIFRAYDIDKDGLLNKSELRLLISDIYKHGNFENFQQSVVQDVEMLASRFDPFTYDVFYKCVEMGAIQHTEKLFRITFDLAEKVKEHLVFALANVQILSTVNPIREPLWSKEVEKMSATNSMAFTPYNSEHEISGFKYPCIASVNYGSANGVYGLHSGVFSDRSGMSSDRSEGVDVYSHISTIYPQPQSDCTKFPYQIAQFDMPQFKTINPIEPCTMHNNFDPQGKKETVSNMEISTIDAEFATQKDDKKIALELDYRINTLISDYFKRYIGHHSEAIIDQKIASSVFTQMYTTFFGLEVHKIESQIIPFRWCNYHSLLVLCNNFSHLLAKEDTIVKIKSPTRIIGELGNNFVDLIRTFNIYGWPLHSRANDDSTALSHIIINICGQINPPHAPVYSLECLLLVMSLKVLFPKHITIVGYYEKSSNPIDTYNCHLYNDILNKLSKYHNNFNLQSDKALISQCAKELLNKIIDIFDVMPKGALVDQSILVKGVPSDCDGVFGKYSMNKYIPRLTIIPHHSDQSTSLVSLSENLASLSNPSGCYNRVIPLTNNSKDGLEAASLFISGDTIVYNSLNPL
ncbi:hypothetical protein BmR1_04g07705 [Babesia microti strain RI]|uniref:protein-serine/threonine phosphatase n=1 Tax=Babesia microti (strain RI) TaxID=1133968 RepID=I7I9W1_BABMR|nr:hypothetical protein BmR1_04g07705 [Babesia microti strain RI]CCF75729.1 hypothetical protein BmR1_04g07705 [Babesia microti strain RI]|eukprot:XP_012650137.1 hypothetical protein BmR1_04g07705 [Babesia microti strain RI]